jgi:hypothetical protein
MSLINDALKRAKEAQHQLPPTETPALHFRPVEPNQTARHSVGLLVPFGLVGVALLLLALVWEKAQERRMHGELGKSPQIVATETVRATPAVAPVTVPARPTPVPSAMGPGAVPPSTTVAASAQSKPGTTPEPAVGAAPVVTTKTASSPAATNANAIPAPEIQPPKPILKLQSIVFGSTKPSAMINGKPLFLGDRIGQFRVTSISEDSVTLVGAGQTNVLSLNQ